MIYNISGIFYIPEVCSIDEKKAIGCFKKMLNIVPKIFYNKTHDFILGKNHGLGEIIDCY